MYMQKEYVNTKSDIDKENIPIAQLGGLAQSLRVHVHSTQSCMSPYKAHTCLGFMIILLEGLELDVHRAFICDKK